MTDLDAGKAWGLVASMIMHHLTLSLTWDVVYGEMTRDSVAVAAVTLIGDQEASEGPESPESPGNPLSRMTVKTQVDNPRRFSVWGHSPF